jgi:hypothetical protein
MKSIPVVPFSKSSVRMNDTYYDRFAGQIQSYVVWGVDDVGFIAYSKTLGGQQMINFTEASGIIIRPDKEGGLEVVSNASFVNSQ